MKKFLAITAPLLVALAACGAVTSAPTPSSTPQQATATAAATPLPSPTPDLQMQAAQAYLQAATTANTADAAIPNGDLLSNPSTVSTLSQLVAPVQAEDSIEQTFLTSLYAINFPSADQLDANTFIRDVTAEIADGQGFATDPTTADWNIFANTDLSPDADVLRHDLGLPQVSAS